MDLKSNNNVVYSCKYHVLWCPKYRDFSLDTTGSFARDKSFCS
jgi:REP element-mobilizing transposase RayT